MAHLSKPRNIWGRRQRDSSSVRPEQLQFSAFRTKQPADPVPASPPRAHYNATDLGRTRKPQSRRRRGPPRPARQEGRVWLLKISRAGSNTHATSQPARRGVRALETNRSVHAVFSVGCEEYAAKARDAGARRVAGGCSGSRRHRLRRPVGNGEGVLTVCVSRTGALSMHHTRSRGAAMRRRKLQWLQQVVALATKPASDSA